MTLENTPTPLFERNYLSSSPFLGDHSNRLHFCAVLCLFQLNAKKKPTIQLAAPTTETILNCSRRNPLSLPPTSIPFPKVSVKHMQKDSHQLTVEDMPEIREKVGTCSIKRQYNIMHFQKSCNTYTR